MNSSEMEQNDGSQAISILVVDDEERVLSAIESILAECGYDKVYCAPSSEAFGILKQYRIDLVLCDLVMPKPSGMEILLKIQEYWPETMVLLMSGYADIAIAHKALDQGATDFLVKPFSALSLMIAIERNLRRRAQEMKRIIEQRNKVLLESIKAFSAAIDAKERGTAQHSERMISMAMSIANALGLSPVEKGTLELAAYMHDIGKIGVKESILLKPGKLSDEEWEEIKLHPDTGSHILGNIEDLADLSQIIRHHHERMDGKGYPDGLSGEEIPILSRILAVADAFDAMTSDRPYRARLSEREALERLEQCAGSQFDPRIVEVFFEVFREQKRDAA
ncbi:MAG: HD-GYP domain-containing protein [Armatimonadota bacterium]